MCGSLPHADIDVSNADQGSRLIGTMMMGHVEPLDSALWFRRIEMIANGEMKNMERALRHACHLLQLAPIPFREVVKLTIDEEDFEALLEAGDFDTAARHLIAQPAALSIEESPDGKKVRATISCIILNRALHGTGDTVTTAVLAAWTTCLLALKTEYGADLISGPRQLERRSQCEPSRRLH